MIKHRAGTKLTAAAVAIQIVIGASQPAFAQRRRAEPEANPDFAQSLQGGGGGGPIGEPASAEPSLSPEEPASRSQIQGVQIGASGGQRPAAQAAPSALETRVTVRVKGAPLATFLDTIAAQSKVNFIMTEGVETKRVTAFLQNVTVREALQVLLEIKGLTYQQIGRSNTYVVTPRSKQAENYITRIYALSHIPLIPLTDASGQSGGSGIGGAAAAATAGGGTSSGAGAGGAAGGATGGSSDNSVAIVTVLKSVLTKNGQVAIEPRTNSIVVTDIPEVFPQVEQIIAELDRKAPQVMIEAQIVEIDSNRARELGFEWGGANGELASFTAGARDSRFPFSLSGDPKNLKFFDPATNIISGLGESKANESEDGESNAADVAIGSNLLTSIVDLTSLKIVLRALVSRSEARFLGKPKILTLNNKTAVIAISANQAVGVQSQASAIGQTGAQSVQGAERIATGLTLRVTPQVNKEGYITMLVQPSFTDVTESAVSRSDNRVFDPISRAASTLVRVRNAQTLVLGGLLRSTETKVVRKVPLLGYIPIIGWFFTSSSTRRQNSDLVIFITPTIVSD